MASPVRDLLRAIRDGDGSTFAAAEYAADERVGDGRRNRVGAENLSTSCDLGVFVDEPAQSIDPYGLYVLRRSSWWEGSQRCRLAERAVWPMFVVVRHVARQHSLHVSLFNDQHPVEQLTADGANPSLRERVHPRCLHRRAQDLDALGAEDRIEAVGELGVPVADEKLNCRRGRPAP